MGFPWRFVTRLVRARDPLRRGRLPLVLLIGTCLVAVTAAMSGAATTPPGLRFAQVGHWVANPSLGMIFHVNGAARTVDAQAAITGMESESQVVQGDTSGYVVGRSRIIEFGKSNLSVEQTLTPPTGERPVAIEAKGGPYLVYREAGSVVRLGDTPATIPAGRLLGQPVTTPDGTLWLHRTDSNVLCHLAPKADRVSCPATAPRGHPGALTVVDKQAVFVDTETDTMSPVADDGLGRPTRIGVDLPPTAQVADADVSGRVAILDPAARRIHLVDATGLGTDRAAAAPVSVSLPDGTYSAPTASRSSVVLLDLRHNTVLTYDGAGRQQQVTAMPPETGEPRLTRGEDERVYVEGAEGRHVLVVDHDGGIGVVPVTGSTPPTPSPTLVAPPTEPSRGPEQPPTASRQPPGEPDRATAPTEQRPPAAGSRTGAPNQPTPARKPLPASPPGMPPGLKATANGANLVVTWSAAAANGATVSGYQVAWTPTSGSGGGSATRPGSARSMTITGLTRGTAYRITVSAQNSAGRGTPATAQATVPPPPRSVTVSRGRATTYQDLCDAPDCAFMRVVMTGFRPNTNYSIKPHSDEWPNYNPGATLRTDAKGNLTFQDFPFDDVGQHVWVTVDGLESNHFLWRAG
ncbi:fibronectin type III domain-containing protein [Micromonospora pisi]|nr:fibronectin type III domain-containing protein [Micromonospora pisi]